MPIHDWSRVFDRAFHDFHLAWIAELRSTLNGGVLPPDYYALVEQVARPTVADVLTLQTTNGSSAEWSGEPIPAQLRSRSLRPGFGTTRASTKTSSHAARRVS